MHTTAPRSGSGSPVTSIVKSHISFGSEVRGSKGYLDWEFLYDYDSSGNLAQIVYPNGEVVPYFRNRLGQATQVGEYARNITYYPNGGLKSLRFGNGILTRYSQQSNGRLSRIQHGSLWDRSYSYQNASYLSRIRDNLNPVNSLHFEYDQLYQLKRVYGSNSNGGRNNSNILEEFTYAIGGDITERRSRGVIHRFSYDTITNRLSGVSRTNGGAYSISYTPDGRVREVESNNSSRKEAYHYSADKQMVGYDEPGNDSNIPGGIRNFRYDYDAMGNKIRTQLNGSLENYSIYNHLGQMMFKEDRTDETVLHMYLDERLIARRSTAYDVAYADCRPVRQDAQSRTVLYHLPVYVRRHDGEPVFWGACESSGLYWQHISDLSTAYLNTISSIERRMFGRVNQVDRNNGKNNNMGHLRDYMHHKDVKQLVGNPERRYSSSGTYRYYKCYQRWRVLRFTYDIQGRQIKTETLRTGDYDTGRSRTWRSWQRKPSFSCGNQGSIEANKIPWPNV